MKSKMMVILAVAGLAATGTLAIVPATAAASSASSAQVVSGTALGLLAIVAVPVASFTTGFEPGSTADTTGLITLTDTEPSWSLSVHDEATADPGHMVAASTGCTGSAPDLADPLAVDVTSVLPGANSAGAVSISGSPTTVSSGTDQLLADNVFTANYAQTFTPGESMLLGCVYSMTATYTLQ